MTTTAIVFPRTYRLRRVVLLLSLALAGCGQVTESTTSSADIINDTATNPPATDSYSYLNQLRTAAGMNTLNTNSVLAQAAQNHSHYLASNNVISHDESAGLPGYTGATPSQRVVYAGYFSLTVGEGIANGKSANDAIDNLMSAIYHRYALLDFTIDEIGFGYTSAGITTPIFVHNTGNRALNDLCQTARNSTPSFYYVNVCEPNSKVDADKFDAARDAIILQNPTYVLWPPANASDISPAFFEETPDPLADYSVSGYPVSIQFNTGTTGKVVLNSIRLYDVTHGHYVDKTRLLDSNTDPNGNFTPYEFALFPLERLNWSTQYRVEAEYSDSENKTITWNFTTKTLDSPIVYVNANDTGTSINKNTTTYLYFVPANGLDTLQTFKARYPASATVSLEFYDSNTLRVKISGDTGDTITLTLDDTRSFAITLK